MLLSLTNHTIDFLIAQSARILNRDRLFLTGTLILCGYVHDTVYVNIKGNFNLRYTTASRSDTIQLEHTKLLIVICHRTLTLQNTDIYSRLVVRSR